MSVNRTLFFCHSVWRRVADGSVPDCHVVGTYVWLSTFRRKVSLRFSGRRRFCACLVLFVTQEKIFDLGRADPFLSLMAVNQLVENHELKHYIM
jgi:hypothetical protein